MRQAMMVLTAAVVLCLVGSAMAKEAPAGVKVGVFPQEVRTVYRVTGGLPDNDVRSVAITSGGDVYAGTGKGLAIFDGNAWCRVGGVPAEPVTALASRGDEVLAATKDSLYSVRQYAAKWIAAMPPHEATCIAAASEGLIYLGTKEGLYRRVDGAMYELYPLGEVRQVAISPAGDVAVASSEGLYLGKSGRWTAVTPNENCRRWVLHDVRGVAFDSRGRLWFAGVQGAGCRDGQWRFFTGAEGLPYDDFTTMTSGEDGVVWFGTHIGAIRYDGEDWFYRQGPRWLPDDEVRAIAVADNGTAWFATPNGAGRIERRPMTLAEKARHYEDIIDARHRRTPYGYVLECGLARPGDTTEWSNHDSDNDGLWTAMYGAGECFAYAATGDELAKKRAKKAFEALKFLNQVTQGGEKPALPGFPARSILPTSGPNPNETQYTLEKDEERKRTGDRWWKVMWPRWPRSADGEWFWKCDTSSDELDGHYFFNAVYYDLVAETEAEKEEVRKVILATTDHLIDNGFNLVDWDGKPTRWAIFGPDQLNHNPVWYEERGLNSLSMLSYLAVAEHVSDDAKYRSVADELIKDHSYHLNTFVAKMHEGPGTGNQSDDEMAIMGFYSLVNYETDPDLSRIYNMAFWSYWQRERREVNPFFNFAFGGATGGELASPWGDAFGPAGFGLDEAVETLVRFPVELINWPLKNSHRKDIAPHPMYRVREGQNPRRGYMRDGNVLPVDNRHFNHWNTDPWTLDYGGNGRSEADGATFLLPYYMGLHYGFIIEE